MNHKNIFPRSSLAVAVALSLAGCAGLTPSAQSPRLEHFAAGDLPPPIESVPQAIVAPVVAPVAEADAEVPIALSGDEAAASEAAYNVGYSVRRAEATGVKRVFDDGYETYVQFSAPPGADADVFDAQGNALNAARYGDYLVISGVHRSVVVQVGWLYSPVSAGPLDLRAATELGDAVPAPGSVSRLAAAPVRTDSVFVQAADAAAEAVVPEAPEVVRSGPHAGKHEKRHEQVAAAEVGQAKSVGDQTTLVRVHFAKGAARLAVSKQTRAALVQAAKQATRVILHGEAGGAAGVATNTKLARARALSAKQMLVSEGVAAAKIVLTYSAGGVSTAATSRDGRAANRRVDFVFVGPGQERMQVAVSELR